MAKNKISEWSAVPANNTDVGGIDIAEGCAPSGINNAIREMMAQIKDQQSGTDADNFTVGGNLIVTGSATFSGGLSTDLAVADGGTGASTAADARTNLGLGSIATQASSSVSITGGTITGITDITVADGGTGASTLAANAVLLGNGTSTLQTVAPSTSGNVLTSNGTTWISDTAPNPAKLTTATGSAPSYSARAFVNFNGDLDNNLAATYTQNNGSGGAGTILTVTRASHGYIAGQRVYLNITSGTTPDGMYTVISVTTDTIILTGGTSLLTAGTANINQATVVGAGNISSVAKQATGDYTINFIIPMASDAYALIGSVGSDSNVLNTVNQNVAYVRVQSIIPSAGLRDTANIAAAIFQ